MAVPTVRKQTSKSPLSKCANTVTVIATSVTPTEIPINVTMGSSFNNMTGVQYASNNSSLSQNLSMDGIRGDSLIKAGPKDVPTPSGGFGNYSGQNKAKPYLADTERELMPLMYEFNSTAQPDKIRLGLVNDTTTTDTTTTKKSESGGIAEDIKGAISTGLDTVSGVMTDIGKVAADLMDMNCEFYADFNWAVSWGMTIYPCELFKNELNKIARYNSVTLQMYLKQCETQLESTIAKLKEREAPEKMINLFKKLQTQVITEGELKELIIISNEYCAQATKEHLTWLIPCLVVGVIALCVVIGLAICCCKKKKRRGGPDELKMTHR